MSAWDIKGISKDLVDGLLNKAGKQKDILLEAVVQEVSKYLHALDLPGELSKILHDLTIDIDAKIHLKRGSGGHTLSKLAKHVHVSRGTSTVKDVTKKKRTKKTR